MNENINANIWNEKLDQYQRQDTDLAWKYMETMLDVEMGKQKRDIRRWILLIILLLLLIGICNCPDLRFQSKKTQESGNRTTNPTTPNQPETTHKKTTGLPKSEITKNSGKELQPTSETRSSDDSFGSFKDRVPEDSALPKKNVPPTAVAKTKDLNPRPPAEKSSHRKLNKKNIAVSGNQRMEKGLQPDRSKTQKTTRLIDKRKTTAERQIAKSTVLKIGLETSLKPYIADKIDPVNNLVPPDSAIAKNKDSSRPKDSMDLKGWQVAIGFNHFVPIQGQVRSNFTSEGTIGAWKDYLPVPQFRYRFNKKWSAQIEAQFNAPQYTKNLIIDTTYSNPDPTVPRFENSITLKKLFYLNIPVSLHYQPIKGLDAGLGLQFSRLQNAIGEFANRLVFPSGSDSARTAKLETLKTDPVYKKFSTIEWRLLGDVNYEWKKIMIGIRFNYALTNFVNLYTGTNNIVQARNHSLQLYTRYAFLNRIRKFKK